METNTSMGNDTEATSNKKDIVVPEAIKKSEGLWGQQKTETQWVTPKLINLFNM